MLEKEDSIGNLEPHGTGICLYNYKDPEKSTVVTCAHVLRNKYVHIKVPLTDSGILYLSQNKTLTIEDHNSFWTFDGYNIETKFELNKGKTFLTNDSLDIGVFNIYLPNGIVNNKDTIKITNFSPIFRTWIKTKDQVDLGTSIDFLGFPFDIGSKKGFFNFGIYADDKINPLLRTGVIAWKSNKNKDFLIDGISYGGNSGSPVFTQAGAFGEKPGFIGMVLGHLSDLRYDPNVADFNYGLVRCVWVDEILKLVDKLK